MSSKKASYAALCLIILFGIGYAVSINSAPSGMLASSTLGPSYFPNVLTAILILLCLASLVRTARKQETRLRFPNLKYVLFTIVLTAVFIVCWQKLGSFYPATFVFLFLLIAVYRLEKGWKNAVGIGAAVALGLTAILYVLFALIMNISL